jgi:heme/copper-type cytochrome/quinol oxidase subunit 3
MEKSSLDIENDNKEMSETVVENNINKQKNVKRQYFTLIHILSILLLIFLISSVMLFILFKNSYTTINGQLNEYETTHPNNDNSLYPLVFLR